MLAADRFAALGATRYALTAVTYTASMYVDAGPQDFTRRAAARGGAPRARRVDRAARHRGDRRAELRAHRSRAPTRRVRSPGADQRQDRRGARSVRSGPSRRISTARCKRSASTAGGPLIGVGTPPGEAAENDVWPLRVEEPRREFRERSVRLLAPAILAIGTPAMRRSVIVPVPRSACSGLNRPEAAADAQGRHSDRGRSDQERSVRDRGDAELSGAVGQERVSIDGGRVAAGDDSVPGGAVAGSTDYCSCASRGASIRSRITLFPEFRTPPRPRGEQRMSGRGQAVKHGPGATRSTSRQSISSPVGSLTTSRAASYRT